MSEVVLTIGGFFGGLAVIFGAFGAHALKDKFTVELQKSFETGVKYQMYHALILILSGIIFPFLSLPQKIMGWSFIAGTFLFSFSIYGLCLSASQNKKIRFLGPITPLGGLLLVMGWVFFIYNVMDIGSNF